MFDFMAIHDYLSDKLYTNRRNIFIEEKHSFFSIFTSTDNVSLVIP